MPKIKKNFPIVWLLFLTFVLITILSILRRPAKEIPCANTGNCEESLNLSVDNTENGLFEGVEVKPPAINLATEITTQKVLGSETSMGEKRIDVDLSTQTLMAYQGSELFMEAKISSGKWFETPTGEFTIWKKIRATKMSGGEGADYYYLPNVPYVMFYSNNEIAPGRGFSLHGVYWHNNFGHAMSHGCVNMRTIDAKKLYEWVNPISVGNDTSSTSDNPGTKITVYGKAP